MQLKLINYYFDTNANYYLFGLEKQGFNSYFYQTAYYVKQVGAVLVDVLEVDVPKAIYIGTVQNEKALQFLQDKVRQTELQLHFSKQGLLSRKTLPEEYEAVLACELSVGNTVEQGSQLLIKEAQDVEQAILYIKEIDYILAENGADVSIRESIKNQIMTNWKNAYAKRNKTSTIDIE